MNSCTVQTRVPSDFQAQIDSNTKLKTNIWEKLTQNFIQEELTIPAI